MTKEEARRFEEEMEACGGDLELWEARKNRENESFMGFELEPEKVKRLNSMKALARRLAFLDSAIKYEERPATQDQRHMGVKLLLPPLYFTSDRRVSNTLAQLYAAADFVGMSCPFALYDEEIDGDEEPGEKLICMNFEVKDMWKSYGKMPF